MNYAAIKTHDVANGPGVRVSLFVSGCTHYCKGCFNQEAWDFDYGRPFDAAAEEEILNALKPPYIKGFSLLGGEPFEPANQKALLPFMQRLRKMYPNKTVWCYTGYVYNEVKNLPVLKEINVLVDGPFILAQRDLDFPYRGSRNQRLIDVPVSLEKGEAVDFEL